MNQIAVLAAVETVSYPPRTTRAILRGKHYPKAKNHEAERTEMGKSTICRLWRNSTCSKEYALSDPPSCIRHNLTDSTDFERNSVYLIQILRQKPAKNQNDYPRQATP